MLVSAGFVAVYSCVGHRMSCMALDSACFALQSLYPVRTNALVLIQMLEKLQKKHPARRSASFGPLCANQRTRRPAAYVMLPLSARHHALAGEFIRFCLKFTAEFQISEVIWAFCLLLWHVQ